LVLAVAVESGAVRRVPAGRVPEVAQQTRLLEVLAHHSVLAVAVADSMVPLVVTVGPVLVG